MFFEYLKYFFWASFRRKKIDKLLIKYKTLYKGIVLDIGGIQRGIFKPPKKQVKKWIFADINKKIKPDIVLDVANMSKLKNNSIDVINAIELFEHVKEIDKGLEECFRILKKGGFLILTVPFLYGIHPSPADYQRWTKDKWIMELNKQGFKINKIIIMGLYFTVLCDMFKLFIESMVLPFCIFRYPLTIFLSLIVSLDDTTFVLKNNTLNKYHAGYFIIAKK
ncbi:MAG: class I SAM-dependent methyltransferase [Candidatus Omnitrophica bacterium]|nr:class I SAM-dependent methyltransferase [Candidatus Omnitrophota bacterium]